MGAWPKILFIIAFAGGFWFTFKENTAPTPATSVQSASIPEKPQETTDTYWISNADFSYLCKARASAFDHKTGRPTSTVFQVPSGVTIRYKMSTSPSGIKGHPNYELIPMKKVSVIPQKTETQR